MRSSASKAIGLLWLHQCQYAMAKYHTELSVENIVTAERQNPGRPALAPRSVVAMV